MTDADRNAHAVSQCTSGKHILATQACCPREGLGRV